MAERFPRRVPGPYRSRTARGPALRTSTGNATVSVLSLVGVVGLVALGNHGAEFDLQQATYASRQDCLDDWGSEDSCREYQTNNGHPVYVGPRYYWDPGRGRPVVITPDGAERVAAEARIGASGSRTGHSGYAGTFARGGFGGIGRGVGFGHS